MDQGFAVGSQTVVETYSATHVYCAVRCTVGENTSLA